MSGYIHERRGWPRMSWDDGAIAGPLAAVSRRQGRLMGRMESLGFVLQERAVLETLTQDVVKSSEIEGEILDREQVRSSVARRLGMDIGALAPADRNVDGVVEMMLDATQNYSLPLDEARLFAWHGALFPTGRSGLRKIIVGAWRNDREGPMQVVSGPIGRERTHFEAPPAARLPAEMSRFTAWFNDDQAGLDPILKAALGHLWFVTVHPFDDGNGRIARAAADMLLARADNSAQRFYSMSSQIRVERRAYYAALESTQKGGLDVTGWILWFLDCLGRALDGSEGSLAAVLARARFWEGHGQDSFNQRQRDMINRLFDGFEGALTTSKWAKISGCSQDSALRDISDLVSRGVLAPLPGGGRSTRYGFAAERLA